MLIDPASVNLPPHMMVSLPSFTRTFNPYPSFCNSSGRVS